MQGKTFWVGENK